MMKSRDLQLLKSLASGVRPIDAILAPLPTSEPAGGFDALLSGAIGGHPKSELGVRFAPSVSGIFDQLAQHRIARGVDLAAIEGVEHALILHDQWTLRVDVRNRIVLDASTLAEQEVIDQIDGFVSVKTPESTGDGSGPDPLSSTVTTPARVVRNASLVHALAGRAPQIEQPFAVDHVDNDHEIR